MQEAVDEESPPPLVPLPGVFTRADVDPTLAQMVDKLRESRERVAFQARALAFRELKARELRSQLEQGFRREGKNKGESEEAAKLAPEYVSYARGTAGVAYARAIAEAVAESERLLIQGRLALAGEAA